MINIMNVKDFKGVSKNPSGEELLLVWANSMYIYAEHIERLDLVNHILEKGCDAGTCRFKNGGRSSVPQDSVASTVTHAETLMKIAEDSRAIIDQTKRICRYIDATIASVFKGEAERARVLLLKFYKGERRVARDAMCEGSKELNMLSERLITALNAGARKAWRAGEPFGRHVLNAGRKRLSERGSAYHLLNARTNARNESVRRSYADRTAD